MATTTRIVFLIYGKQVLKFIFIVEFYIDYSELYMKYHRAERPTLSIKTDIIRRNRNYAVYANSTSMR